MEQSLILSYLGPNSYPSIVSQIAEKIKAAEGLTIAGNNVLTNMFTTLNESVTPMMDLREFTTNAEKLAPNDAKLSDIVNFVKDKVNGGDLNFLVNMAKEEHFKEVSRNGFPNVEDTIKEFESLFNETPSIIEQGIKNGLLDNLQSNLMMEIKSSIVPDGKTKILKKPEDVTMVLNENQVLFSNNDLIQYCPVGISMEDVKNNRMLLLTESDVLSIDRGTKEFSRIPGEQLSNLNIPEGHKRMLTAIQELTYNPIEECFTLNENWDFNLKLNKNGELVLLNEEDGKLNIIESGDLKVFLMESINHYSNLPVVPTFFNKEKYTKDADNLIVLCENHKRLIKIDNLRTIRNLNENTYVIVEPNSIQRPKIIAGTGLTESKLFEDYVKLNESCNNILNKNLVGLFENQLTIEKDFNLEKANRIHSLNEDQKELNLAINETNNLLKIAEENSPAWLKLNESKTKLENKLDENLINLNGYVNNHNLYE